MEERIEYAGQSTGRRGKTFVGGYLDNEPAQKIQDAAKSRGMTVVDFLEYISTRLMVDYVPQGCACGHE